MQAKRLWLDSKNAVAPEDWDGEVERVFHLELSMTAGDCHCLAPSALYAVHSCTGLSREFSPLGRVEQLHTHKGLDVRMLSSSEQHEW